MAQDFRAAFALGEDATTINTIDADDVALAVIQRLNAKLESKNAALRAELDALKQAVARLRDAR
jgi:trimeric autotransporter adhesin